MRRAILILGGLLPCFAPTDLPAQDRDAKVRDDRATFADSDHWIYNDLDAGIRRARDEGKPLLVVFRCIPCEACHEFDESVAARDPVVRDLMDRFVCVRIPQANTIDLTRFQFDFDQSFAAFLMHPDGTLYGRFGTRSGRDNEEDDISLEGLRAALDGALRMHADHRRVKPTLAGKQVTDPRYALPDEYPSLRGRYGDRIDFEAESVARTCMHCHQIGEAERLVFRLEGEPVPDEVLFPYPHPTTLGLTMDPKAAARVEAVAPGSVAERAGFAPGDAIDSLAGQPLLSIADIQWVLHHAPAEGTLEARVRSGDASRSLTIPLDSGWRRRGDISWRATTWDLRRMALGGMVLKELTDSERRRVGIPDDRLALRVDHVGQYDDHAVAMRAGVRKGDIVVSYDGRTGPMSESALLAYALQEKRPGEAVKVELLRDGTPQTVTIELQ